MLKTFSKIIGLMIVLIAIVLYSSKENTQQKSVKKKLTLNEQFLTYVPTNIYKKCDGLNDICKKFYIGYYLFSNKNKSTLSLKYLIKSYENNVSKVLNDSEAKEYYLADTIARLYDRTNDYKNSIKFWKLSIKAGNDRNICYLGREYDVYGKFEKAYKAFKEGVGKKYPPCYTDLGMYYFNGKYVQKNRDLAGKLWTVAYNDNSYGIVENYNMGVYFGYKKNNQRYKYHMLKAANMGDTEAKYYLKNTNLKNISTTKLFLEEAMGSKYWNLSQRKNREFSNNYDLYYRLKKMFSKKWVEDYGYREAKWKHNKELVVKFDKGLSSLIYENKKLILQTTINSYNKNKILANDIELLYKVLLIDLSGAKDIINLHHKLVGRIVSNTSFKYNRKFDLYGYGFIWYASYDKKIKKLIVEIQIDESIK